MKNPTRKENLFPYNLSITKIQKNIIKSIVKPKIRLKIFLLLFLDDSELNVSQISKKINEPKSTISRHLKKLEMAGILESQEIQTRGKINPKFYRLNRKNLYNIEQHKKVDINSLSNPKKRLNYYKQSIFLIKSLYYFLLNGFDLFQPLIESLEKKFDTLKTSDADQKFGLKYLYPKLKLDFDPIIISEERLDEFHSLYQDFREKLIKIRDKGNKRNENKSMVVLHTLIPLKDLLTLDFSSELE